MSQVNTYHFSEKLCIGENTNQTFLRSADTRFYYFILLAIFLHSLFLISVTSSKPRRLGSPKGIDNAISVSLVNTHDILSKATVDDQSSGPLTQPLPPSKEERKTQTSEEVSPSEKDLKKEKQEIQEISKTPNTKMEQIPALIPDEKAPMEKIKEKNNSESATKKNKSINQDQTKSPNQETKKVSKLDLSDPRIFTAPSGGGGAGVQRPPGITRSGENDDFARGVIRALQQTMPQLSNTFGRVTVRIVLDKNGGLVATEVLVPSSVPGLDQSVVFATRQSSFPLPPLNANSADLTFFVTYIYR